MCKCGHKIGDHRQGEYQCDDPWGENCECQHYEQDDNWEPADPPGWEGGFAWNH